MGKGEAPLKRGQRQTMLLIPCRFETAPTADVPVEKSCTKWSNTGQTPVTYFPGWAAVGGDPRIELPPRFGAGATPEPLE
jgi:hypothetical protein